VRADFPTPPPPTTTCNHPSIHTTHRFIHISWLHLDFVRPILHKEFGHPLFLSLSPRRKQLKSFSPVENMWSEKTIPICTQSFFLFRLWKTTNRRITHAQKKRTKGVCFRGKKSVTMIFSVRSVVRTVWKEMRCKGRGERA
jgi:hypothetical protein